MFSKTTIWVIVVIGVALLSLFFIFRGKETDVNDNNSENETVIEDEKDDPGDQLWSPIEDTLKASQIILITTDSVKLTLQQFPDANDTSGYLRQWKEIQYANLDADTIPELMVKYYTGGAHCCDMYTIFKKSGINEYKEIFEIEGGVGSLQVSKGDLNFNFAENTGYFFTCYACFLENLPDSTFVPYIWLHYDGKNFIVKGGNESLNQSILRNLEFLSKREIPPLDVFEMDDGTRKAYAEHVIAWYFNNGENMDATAKLFKTFYHGADSQKVFDEIVQYIQGMGSMSYSGSQFVKKVMKTKEALEDSI